MILLLVVVSSTLSGVARAQRPDTLRRDSIATRLLAVEVIESILPVAGPTIGSAVPARVSSIAGAAVEAWKPRLLTDALVRVAGVSLYDDLGSPYKPTLATRGFTASPVVGLPQGVSVFLDGVPVNEPDAGQVNFDLLPLGHVERIEILSGTASLLGPHSLGGAINLLTRRGQTTPEGMIELAAGSFDNFSIEASHGGTVAPDWRYYAGGGYSSDGGWRQVTGARHGNGFLNFGRQWQEAGVNLQASVASGYAETAGSLPLSVYRVKPDSNLSAADFEGIDQIHVALSAHRRLRGALSSGVIWLRQSDAVRFNVNQETDPDVRSFSRIEASGVPIGAPAARLDPAPSASDSALADRAIAPASASTPSESTPASRPTSRARSRSSTAMALPTMRSDR